MVLLNVSFCNIKNIKTNFIFAQKQICNSEITFHCETGLPEVENSFYRDFVLDSNYFTLSESDTFLRPERGRPFGGKTWIVKKSIKVNKHAFINKYVSFLDVNFSDKAFLVIGVYLPFNNSCHDSFILLTSCIIEDYRRKSNYSNYYCFRRRL
jgi:hypothetical protein